MGASFQSGEWGVPTFGNPNEQDTSKNTYNFWYGIPNFVQNPHHIVSYKDNNNLAKAAIATRPKKNQNRLREAERLPRTTKSSSLGGDGEPVNSIRGVSKPARIEAVGEGRSTRLVDFPEEVRRAQDPECEPSANVVQGTKLEQSRCIYSWPHRERRPRISQGPRARCFVPTRNQLPKSLGAHRWRVDIWDAYSYTSIM